MKDLVFTFNLSGNSDNNDCKHFGNGVYTKIHGDSSQPHSFNKNTKEINYTNKEGKTLFVGKNMKGCCKTGSIINHYVNTTLLSQSKITNNTFIPGTLKSKKDTGKAYIPKFDNPLYIGGYSAEHSYVKLLNGDIIYTNHYKFDNGKTSSAIYINKSKK
jgi:hypothetical protein